MLSSIPAFFSPDPVIGNSFSSSFDNGFPPWDDCSEFFLNDDHQEYPQSPKPGGSSSGSDEPNRSDQNNSNSSSDEPNQTTVSVVVDERKRRRMISNRESARRSRMRKQKHLENLRNQLNRLRVENRELTNRLRFVMYHWTSVRRDNDRLRSEHSFLRQKLSNLRQIMMLRQLQQFTSSWPCNNFITTEQIASSLITS